MSTGLSDRVAEEQAALRRVATLVARAAPAEDLFAAVAAEVGQLMGVDFTILSRFDPDGMTGTVAAWGGADDEVALTTGTRWGLGGHNVTTLVFDTGRPARIDAYAGATGPSAQIGRRLGFRSAVGAPISVQGRLWGVMLVAYTHQQLLPGDTEVRLAGFTELVATAIADAQARVELRGFAEEQSALRRVATLVAVGAPPEEVFAAVSAEVGRLLAADATVLSRYHPDGTAATVAPWGRPGVALPPVGTQVRLGGRNSPTLVFATGAPVRVDDYVVATGPAADDARNRGVRSSVGVPITVEGRLWGVMSVLSGRTEPLPADTEARLAGFTELVATAIADAEARVELRGFAEQQAALGRVATLVARGAPPEQVFSAVAAEVGRVLGVDLVILSRYDSQDMATAVGVWSGSGDTGTAPVGGQFELGGQNVHTVVFRTGRPARVDLAEASGPPTTVFGPLGIRSAVGVPISVESRLWGVMIALSTREEFLPPNLEARLAGFTELVGTALANADAQAALTASRARIVATADATRRRIERDLHDGAQQRLVSLTLHLRGAVLAAVPPGAGELAGRLAGIATGLTGVLDELREIARGLHPASLTAGGLRPALKTLGRRCAVPVRLDVRVDGRLPEPIELATYHAVAEALTNAAKYADATVVDVHAEIVESRLHVRVHDDGNGGAHATGSSGLTGLTDRVEALGGRFSLASPPGAGTTLEISLPLPGQVGSAPDSGSPPLPVSG